MNIFTSKVTWTIVAMFVIGGLEAVGVISVGVGTTLLGIFGIGGIVSHNTQIKAGNVR